MIQVTAVANTGWKVCVFPGSMGAASIGERDIQRLVDPAQSLSAFIFPQPPSADAPRYANNPDLKLCTTTNPSDIFNVYRRIASRTPREADAVTAGGAGDMVVFGRYLFETLLGNCWDTITAHADKGKAGHVPVELALAWGPGEWQLSRLPWEMMHNGNNFLTNLPDRPLSITRLVVGASQTYTTPLPLPLRVLFVVGSMLGDPEVQPGAEYVGLLRRLGIDQARKAAGAGGLPGLAGPVPPPGGPNGAESAGSDLGFNPYVLVRATSARLQEAISIFQPSVVHFICHGGVDNNGAGYLELIADDDPNASVRYTASVLHGFMTRDTPQGRVLPPVVVLNACYTASSVVAQSAVPVGVQLVSMGVPIVVGMAGQVADRVCRLFGWRFYEALLAGQSVVEATAQGRREGFLRSYDPFKTADWSFPTLFMGEQIDAQLTTEPIERAIRFEGIAAGLRTRSSPPLLCGRQEFLEAYRRLVNPARTRGPNVLMIEAPDIQQSNGVQWPQYGRTRMVGEIAAHAVRDGHLPCLLPYDRGESMPENALQLGLDIAEAMELMREKFRLSSDAEGYEIEKLADVAAGVEPSSPLHTDVGSAWTAFLRRNANSNIAVFLQKRNAKELDVDGTVVSRALRVDLRNLAAKARQELDNPDLKVLLLINNIHCFWGAAMRAVVNIAEADGVSDPGMDDPANPAQNRPSNIVPIVLARKVSVEAAPLPGVAVVSASLIGPDADRRDQTDLDFLNIFAKKIDQVVRMPLKEFGQPDEERLAYTQFLLQQDPPLAVCWPPAENAKVIDDLFNNLSYVIKGIPSRLSIPPLDLAISGVLLMGAAGMTPMLREASDEDIFNPQAASAGGAG